MTSEPGGFVYRGLDRAWTIVARFLPNSVATLIRKATRVATTEAYRRALNSRPGTHLLNRRIERLAERAQSRAPGYPPEYGDYIRAQISKSFRATRQSLWGQSLQKRTEILVRHLDQVLPAQREQLRVLCVGPRSGLELDYIEKRCRVQTQGLDLFSDDPRISVGDMADMPFRDSYFDAIYACHSLEHALDVQQALDEFVRVVKAGGVLIIEVPIRYEPSEVDRWDLKSVEELSRLLSPAIDRVSLKEDVPATSGSWVARLATTVKK